MQEATSAKGSRNIAKILFLKRGHLHLHFVRNPCTHLQTAIHRNLTKTLQGPLQLCQGLLTLAEAAISALRALAAAAASLAAARSASSAETASAS